MAEVRPIELIAALGAERAGRLLRWPVRKSGTLNPPGLPEWPQYSTATDTMLNFTAAGAVAGPDPAKARLDLVVQPQ